MTTTETLPTSSPPRLYSAAEYLHLCDKFGAWFEMVQGQIYWRFNGEVLPDSIIQILLTSNEHQLLNDYPMAAENHDLLVGNIYALLRNTIQGKPYKVYTQAPNIYIALTGSYRVPDATVTPLQTIRNEKNLVLNPLLIVEILSPSTQQIDRVAKLKEYKYIETLQEYILIEQDQLLIEHYLKQTATTWLYQTYESLTETLHLPTINSQLKVEEIYQGVEL